MSEHTSQGYQQGEGLGLDFSGTNDNTSVRPHTGQWMAHWMQACKAWSSKGREKHHNNAHVGNSIDQFKGHECLAVEQFNSKEIKHLCLDLNQNYASGCNGQSSSTVGDVDLIPHVLSGETVELDEIMFSDSRKLTESFMKWKSTASYLFQNLDDFGSKNKHFPMLDINGKIETVMDSREESYFHDAMFDKPPVSSSLVNLAPDNSCLIDNTEKAARFYEFFQPDLESKCQKRKDRASCTFSCGPAFKVSANTELSCRPHKLCYCSKGAKQNNDSMSRSFGISWRSLKDGSSHVLRESSTNHFPCHFSTEEHGKNVKDDSTDRLLLGQKRHTQQACSDMHICPSKLPKVSTLDVSQRGSYQNLNYVENGEGFQKFSSTVNSLLVADEMGFDQCQIEMMTGGTAFTHVKEFSFSETFMMPTKQYYGDKVTTTELLENCTSDENRRDHGELGTHFMGRNNEPSTNADTLYRNYFHRSSSTLGESFSRLPKSAASASQAQETSCRSADTGISGRVEPPASTERATGARNKDAAGQFFSRIKIAGTSNSTLLQDNVSELETCSRWVKRLQHKSPSTDWSQMCDGSSSAVQNICGGIDDYNRCLKEKSIPLSDNNNPSSIVSEEALQPRIRSWRRNCHRPVSAVTFLPVNGKKFASIRAMALMGNLIKNYKPCKFQRKEASVIWTV